DLSFRHLQHCRGQAAYGRRGYPRQALILNLPGLSSYFGSDVRFGTCCVMMPEELAEQEPSGLSAIEGREIELKLELRPEDAARLGTLKSLPQARLGIPKAEQIVTVYFDTPELALRRAGLSLRLRHAGARRIQTVKSLPEQTGVAIDRAEDEVPLNGAGPD